MANIKVDFTNSGLKKDDILKHAGVIKEINQELEEQAEDENDFCGWIHLPSIYYKSKEYEKLKKVAKNIRKNSDILLVIGIGGSYLGARAIIESLHSSIYYLEKEQTKIIYVGNNLSPNYINDVIDYIQDKDFSINVISKSGTTTEPGVSFRIFREILENKYGLEEARKRIYVTTDEKKGALRTLANKEGYETFVIPNNVGGRFSVLTPVGLLPIAVSGINTDDLLMGAMKSEERFSDSDLKYNECYQYAVARNALYDEGKEMEILESYEPKLFYFEEWWKQLFGESEGKDGKGLYPSSCIFTTDLHSLGQYIQQGKRIMFETVLNIEQSKTDIEVHPDEDNLDNLNYLAGKKLSYINEKAMEGTIKAHKDGNVPNILINIEQINAENIGMLIYFFEKACGASGKLLEVNPFNQPGVEAYKTNMFKLLGKPGF